MSDNTQRLIPANTTLLQPGSRFFRISDALNYQVAVNQTAQGAIDNTNTNVTALQGQVTALQGTVSALEGQIGVMQGQITSLQSQVTALIAFQASFNYIQAEVSTGMIFLDQRTIYRRSFVINGSLNTALNNFVFPHGIVAINYVVTVQASAVQAVTSQYPITFLNMATAPSLSTGISCWADATNIVISVGTTAFANAQVLVTLWYTATDR